MLETIHSPNAQRQDITDHLVDFRIEIIRRASLAVMLVAGTAAWMVMSLNPFPGWAFLILLLLVAGLSGDPLESRGSSPTDPLWPVFQPAGSECWA